MQIKYFFPQEYPRDMEGLQIPANSIEDKKCEEKLMSLMKQFSKSTQTSIAHLADEWRSGNIDETFERVLRTATSNAIECDISGVGFCRFWFYIEKFMKDTASIRKFENKYLKPAIDEIINQLPEIWRRIFYYRMPDDVRDRVLELYRNGVIPFWDEDIEFIKKVSGLRNNIFQACLKEKIIPFVETKEKEITKRELDGLSTSRMKDAHQLAYMLYSQNSQLPKREVARSVVAKMFPSLTGKLRAHKIDTIRKRLEKRCPQRTKRTGKRKHERPEPVYHVNLPRRRDVE